jgi:hypothetical protein
MSCSFQTSTTTQRIVPLDIRGVPVSPVAEKSGDRKTGLERHRRRRKTSRAGSYHNTASRHAGQIVWALPIGKLIHQNGY